MLNFNEINAKAMERSEHVLSQRFDAEAYIVYVLSKTLALTPDAESNVDIVPNSNVDEAIQNMLRCFVDYMSYNSQGLEATGELVKVLTLYKQIIAEIYQGTHSSKEREFIKKTVSEISEYVSD